MGLKLQQGTDKFRALFFGTHRKITKVLWVIKDIYGMRLKSVFIPLGVFLCIGLTQPYLQKSEPWHLKKHSKEIFVFSRNAGKTAFKELRAVTQLKTSLTSVVALLNDWDSYPEWVYRCGVSKTLKQVSDTEVIHYQTIITPWPVDTRDLVVNVRISQDPKTKTVVQTTRCVPDYIPPVEGYVRVSQLKSLWILTPLQNGFVKIDYQLLVDPGGNIPPGLVNIASIDGPYETLLKMKELVLKEKYQKTSYSYIAELAGAY